MPFQYPLFISSVATIWIGNQPLAYFMDKECHSSLYAEAKMYKKMIGLYIYD